MSILLFIYALLLGSFYNVVGLRVPVHKSIVKPRSACSNCHTVLSPAELIPVVSYFIQGGRCRHCKVRLSPIYPLGELLTGVLFVFAYRQFGLSLDAVIAWTLISLVMIITVSDIAYMLIPDRILIVFAGLFIVERIADPLTPWWDSIIGAAAGFFLLLLIALASKGGMGGGDIKLYAVLGFAMGVKAALLSFFFATLYGAAIGIIGLCLGVFKRKKPIPFGPFIGLGALTSFFFYQKIIDWYLSLF
ncbi:prepilin peptidase [Heyndrickxia acidicola]|uniref:Prepilin peptidase n=1 Tax=Heyndrickxia acidicola TaxID=209389 RepID=A0ABU6MJV5_9BACI|nr:A24 family peptidase [Heyndrickxia acidicola]MED1204800.1 prepilin peptidase [Heyndrickxia acidicola]